MHNRFSHELLDWYEKEKRELPWRETRDPYRIWLSEVIMQQTRIEQGMSYYLKFLDLFPTVSKLAKASESEILNAWQGLGYYSRARNLHHTANYISNELNSVFPSSYSELIKLKGIGPYTAAAISSICFNEVQAVVDGNVERFVSRYFGITQAVNEAKGKNEIQKIVNEFIHPKEPGNFNQAMMEMGATICTPRKPKCEVCIFARTCFALKNESTQTLPLKIKKVKVRDRKLDYLVCFNKNKMLFQKRTQQDIWQGLYDFPECPESKNDFDKLLGKSNYDLIGEPIKIKHVLSHQKLKASFQYAHIKKRSSTNLKGIWLNATALKNTPIPRLIDKYLQENHSQFVD